jgi:hypothetical protein
LFYTFNCFIHSEIFGIWYDNFWVKKHFSWNKYLFNSYLCINETSFSPICTAMIAVPHKVMLSIWELFGLFCPMITFCTLRYHNFSQVFISSVVGPLPFCLLLQVCLGYSCVFTFYKEILEIIYQFQSNIKLMILRGLCWIWRLTWGSMVF